MSSAALAAVRSLPFLLCLYIVGLSASIGRPIWIDEFTHFAFAAEPTSRAAWDMFVATADYNQHGQTGIYIMLNYWTLSYLGIDATLLRLPSILSGLFLMASAVMLFRVLGFSILWQTIVVAALAGQHLLMYFVGEARAYIPIPAAAVGLLVYYVARPHYPRSRVLLAYGTFAAVFGAVMHPYFAVYWPAVCLVGYVHHRAATGERFSLSSLIAFANPILVVVGAGLYVLLGAMTWLREQPHFGLDPFEWLHRHGPLANFTDYSHVQFLSSHYVIAAGLTGVAVLGLLLLPADKRKDFRAFWAPVLLIVMSLALSLLISLCSYLAQYWVLPRQWVGSVALVAIGVIWLWAEAARIWARHAPWLGLVVCAVAALIVSRQSLGLQRDKLPQLIAYLADPPSPRDAVTCLPPNHIDVPTMPNEARNDAFVALANRNIACGGQIWPVFREYYSGPPAPQTEQQASSEQTDVRAQ